MSQYKAQILLDVLSGYRNRGVSRGSIALAAKGRAQGVASYVFNAHFTPPAAVAAVMRQLPRPWRLYITGHGEPDQQTLGGWNILMLATYLQRCGLADNEPGVISLLACKLALGLQQHTNRRELVALGSSFAGRLHLLLGNTYGIHAPLHARTTNVGVAVAGPFYGRKVTPDPITQASTNKQPYSKVTFYWQGGMQRFYFSGNETV